jgi:hypothetical protein
LTCGYDIQKLQILLYTDVKAWFEDCDIRCETLKFVCLTPLMWVCIQLRRGVLDITLGDKVCQWLAAGHCLEDFFCWNKSSSRVTQLVPLL